MSKSIGKCFYDKLTFDNLLMAHERAKRNKSNKSEVIRYEMDLESNLINTMNSLKNGSYKLSEYREFKVYEPKERIIKSLPYKDRIVQQWYIHEFIMPYIVPRLVSTCSACILGRGTLYAVRKTQEYMRKMKKKYGNYYIIKLDIKKYFYNIDRDILYEIMKSFIRDKRLLWLTKIFIYDNSDKLGIPIGNYTSQYFANIYLSLLDRYVVGEMGIKYYVRYMDDIVILVKDKKECKNVMNKVRYFLSDKLKLDLNEKSRYYPSDMGVNYCGYIIYETHRLLRKRNKIMIKKKIKRWRELDKEGILDRHSVLLSYNSWCAHVKHANSYLYKLIIDREMKLLLGGNGIGIETYLI